FQEMPEPERPWMRSYTLRRRDTAGGTVDIDFVLHDHAGPATRWALAAGTGDTIAMFGPSGYFARPEPIERSIAAAGHLLLAGEAGTVRSLRRHLVDRGVPKQRIEFAGYWRRALSQDDAPTADDLAEARERLADAGLQA